MRGATIKRAFVSDIYFTHYLVCSRHKVILYIITIIATIISFDRACSTNCLPLCDKTIKRRLSVWTDIAASDKDRIPGNDNKESADFFIPEELIRNVHFADHTKHIVLHRVK